MISNCIGGRLSAYFIDSKREDCGEANDDNLGRFDITVPQIINYSFFRLT